MSGVDDIWASMQMETKSVSAEYAKRTAVMKSKSDNMTMEKLCYFEGGKGGANGDNGEKKKKKKTSRSKDQSLQIASIAGLNLGSSSSPSSSSSSSKKNGGRSENGKKEEMKLEAERITAEAMLSKIQRDVNGSSDEDVSLRKLSLKKIKVALFEEFSLDAADYGDVFSEICKPIFLRFGDPAEKCRDLSLQIVGEFFRRSAEVMSVLGYFMPALMQRLPPGLAYDEDMKVFVHNLEEHEAFRRGKAVDRQDRVGTVSRLSTSVVEESEELRLQMCRTLQTLISTLVEKDALSIMNPYFHDCIMFIQAHLRDPFSDVKIVACEMLTLLARQEELELGMKFFAAALCRGILPVLRHRHAKVRAAAVEALHYCMTVKDRAKIKGAGTDAIFDLVGFREDNVLPIAAFYKSEVQINYLAELIHDTSAMVREKIAHMLFAFLTEMGDRYDHQQRLLPYLLDLVSDEVQSVAAVALKTLFRCGQQYEEDHHDDVIEKRQYGIDGDERINLDKPLPSPFKERPRIGVRLYVRGNTKRFLTALVGELTNWVSKTRIKSANLLKHIVFLCEEHLTMEAHVLFPMYIKALVHAKNDTDKELYILLLEVYEMVGRYTPVEVYMQYVLPRLRGDPDVVQFGVDSATREAALEFLGALLSGSKASQLPAHFVELASTLSDGFIMPIDSGSVRAAALNVIITLLESVKSVGTGTGLKKVIEAAFLKTGRLNMNDLENAISSVFKAVMEDLHYPSMRPLAGKALLLLSLVDEEIHPQVSTAPLNGARPLEQVASPLEMLFLRRAPSLLLSLVSDVSDGIKERNVTEMEMMLLRRVATAPFDIVASDATTFDKYTTFLMNSCVAASSQSDRDSLVELAKLTVDHLSATATKNCDYAGLYEWDEVLKVNDSLGARNMVIRGNISADKVVGTFVRNVAFEGSTQLKQVRVDVLKTLIYRADLRKSIHEKHLVALLLALIPSVTDSSNPIGLRSSSLDGIDVVLGVLLGSSNDGDSDDDDSHAASPPAPPLKAVAFNQRDEKFTSLPVSEFLVSLTEVLNDASDDLRNRALMTLQHCIPIVPSLECFTTIVERLLSAVLNEDGSDAENEFIAITDVVLHGLAVLDPVHTEIIARKFLRSPDGTDADGGKKLAQNKVNFISGLVGHCDLLATLAAKKKG